MEINDADVAELVDARDLKSLDGNVVWVRVPPPAPRSALTGYAWRSHADPSGRSVSGVSLGFSESEDGRDELACLPGSALAALPLVILITAAPIASAQDQPTGEDSPEEA
jgi:hypothetical protein